MQDYVIQPQKEGKGRSFTATCVAVATANTLFEEARGAPTIRPVWAMFAGTEHELRPFAANLKMGRKAQPGGYHKRGDSERLEFLRSVGYLVAWQREPEGSLVTLYHPELFRLDPGLVDPTGIRFVMLVPSDWSAAQRVDVTSAVRHVHSRAPERELSYLSSLVPTAYLFAAYLDRRTSCPLVADGRFYLQLLVSALDRGFASLPGTDIKYNRSREDWGHNRRHQFDLELSGSTYDRPGIETIGLAHALSFLASHADFEAFLAEQVTEFFARVKGKARLASGAVDLSPFAANG